MDNIDIFSERKPGIKYACEYCDNVYARKDNLLKHIQIKHGKISSVKSV